MSRKDSFITHRAFCDALIEETARFGNAVPPAENPGCRNGMMAMNVGINNFQNADFSGVFRQEIGGIEAGNQMNRFPLWLESANYPSSSSRDNFLMSNANNLSEEMVQMDSQWLSRGHEESFVGGVLKDEGEQDEENKQNMCGGAITTPSSLYYNATSSSSASAPMSATALLQKAAQMGSTRTSGFGLMSPSSFSTSGFDSFKRSRNNEGIEKDEIGKSRGEGESSLTRDFLGVGGKELKSNFFASISSAMENYSRNH